MMRQIFGVAVAAAMLVGVGTAQAFENFVPLGTGYSPEITEIPAFDSERGRINQEADIIETEIYRLQRDDVRRDSHLNRFFSDAEVSGGDESIDY
jgi:hypothetical protein